MNLELMKKIVNGAPSWAFGYCINLNVYTASTGKDAKLLNIVSIADLRDQLAKREPMDLRAVDIPHGTIVLEK
jgi:hypothetical protein